MATQAQGTAIETAPAGPALAKPEAPNAIASPPDVQRGGILGEFLTGEIGIPGTVNYDGRIQAEANPQLRDFSARGTPGIGYSWGEWEKIARTDPAVAAALNLVAAPLRDATLEVEPAEGVAGAEEHAELVRDNLTKWVDPQWSTFIEETVTGTLTFGFDIHEPVLATREDPRVPGGTLVYIAKLAQRLPSSLSMNPWREMGGELSCIVQQGVRRLPDGTMRYESAIELPANRILLTTWSRTGNNYEGYSALRSVWKLAKLREALLKIFAIGSEREALGIPVASVEKGVSLTDEQIDKWQNFLQRIVAHENAAAVPPAGVSFDWKFSPVSNKGHVLDGYERLGKVIHTVFLTQQVTLGVDGTGSRAVGEVHDGTKNDFISGVKALVEATLNGVGNRPYTGLAKRIVDPNFGPQTAYPTIRLVMKRREVGIGELGTAVPALVNAGALTLTADDENDLRDKLGMRPIDPAVREQERAAKQQKALEIAGAAPKDDGEADDSEEGGQGDGGKVVPFRKKTELSERRNPGAPFRRLLFPWEQHLDLRNLEQTLNSQRDDFIEQAGALIHAAVAEQVPELKRQMKQVDQSKPVRLPNLDLSKLEALAMKYVETMRAEGYGAVAKEMRLQPKHLADQVQSIHLEEDDRGDGTAPEMKPQDEAPPSEPQTSAPKRVRASQRIRRMADQLITRLRARVIDDAESEADYLVHQTNGDPDEIAQNVVNRVLENRGLKFEAGSVQAKAFSMGREEFAQDHAGQIAAVKYSAILDSNTCVPCAGEDGKEFEFDSPEHDAHVPPYGECKGGDLCRCLLVYIFNDDGFRSVEEAPEP